MSKRLIISLIMGALLGIVCIVGAQVRSGFSQTPTYLFAFWFNRVLMGLVIGLFSKPRTHVTMIWRGGLTGLFVSFAFYSATGFADIVGFLVGVIYGIIIEWVAHRFTTHTA
ncbi:MAG: hypothetical protein EA375_04290 [Acholeplasmataceae bacterium]|nr:MAG: hypothetical protein EA375_04290 [Acholeplasmataceae bacterium]